MKIAKVMAMMKRGKSIRILRSGYPKGAVDFIEPDTGTGPQWISDDRAAYNLNGTPLIQSAGQFYATYDVNEKKQSEFYFRFQDLPSHLGGSPWQSSPVEAAPMPVTIGVHGDVLKPFRYGGRILFVNEFYLAPFEDDRWMYRSYEVRRDGIGMEYLRIVDGMNLEAAIYPVKFSGGEENAELYDAFSDCVAEIARQQREYDERTGGGTEQD